MADFNRICVVGLGYIGLPTALAFANAGKHVIGVDTHLARVAQLNQGNAPIAEKGIDLALRQAVDSGNFIATTKPEVADGFIIAVPTPLTPEHQPDLHFVEQAVAAIAPVLAKGNLVVLESTSPVGTTDQITERLRLARPDLHFPDEVNIAYCPERVLPGNILQELVANDRVIGGLSPKCAQQAVALYRLFAKGECLTTNARTAEMCKLTENSFRDVNIAFANELSLICDRLEIDVWELIALANRHPRVQILQPGAGVGGHCIAVDPWFMVAQMPDLARLIQTARYVNDAKPQWVIDKVKAAVADCLAASGRTLNQLSIACLGLTFKADVDDVRESPALAITEALAEWHSGALWVVEPNLSALPPSLVKAELVTLDHALTQADVLVLLVDHQLFKQTPLTEKTTPWRVDTKGIWQRLS